ncbi:MAG: DMT family transporter [Acidobacteria bacterium]|nr:DMT family transporter [Acidobacteriota bacterium]
MILAAIFWSTSGLLIKVISLEAVPLAAWRSLVAGLTVYFIARARGASLKLPVSSLEWWIVASYAVNLLLFVSATKLTAAANAIFLQYTAPVYVLIFEPLVFRTRLKRRDVLMVTVAVFGMSLFFYGKLESGSQIGNLLALASGVVFACFAVLMRLRHHQEASTWSALVWGNFLLFAAGAVYGLISSKIFWPTAPGDLLGVLFLGTVQIGIAYALFAFAITRISALEAILLGMLEPLLNPVWVYLGTGEVPSAGALVGGMIILGAIFLRGWMQHRSESQTT